MEGERCVIPTIIYKGESVRYLACIATTGDGLGTYKVCGDIGLTCRHHLAKRSIFRDTPLYKSSPVASVKRR